MAQLSSLSEPACLDKVDQYSLEAKIAGCTALIEARKTPDKSIAWAFLNRGVAYRRMNNYDHAIADYSEAIRLNPGDALAHHNRGSGVFQSGRNSTAPSPTTARRSD